MKRRFLTAALLLLPLLAFAAGGADKPSATEAVDQGVLIARVVPDSPAEKAGIAQGDLLLQVDGKQVSTPREVREILSGHKAGDTVRLLVRREGEDRTVSVKLEERVYRSALGIVLAPRGMTRWPQARPELRGWPRGFQFPFSLPGAVVVAVQPGSPAAGAGLEPGDLIISVGGEKLGPGLTLEQAIQAQKPGDKVKLEVWQPREGWKDLEVTLGSAEDGKTFLGVRYHDASLPGGRLAPRFPPGRRGPAPWGQPRPGGRLFRWPAPQAAPEPAPEASPQASPEALPEAPALPGGAIGAI
jgi:membrane-associated protease RseP (regulator of RpoE activity)